MAEPATIATVQADYVDAGEHASSSTGGVTARVVASSSRGDLPDAEVVALPGAGHNLLVEAGPAVRHILLDWLGSRV
jgi:pimeloyl-ACP methyl ester carboxylesterase